MRRPITKGAITDTIRKYYIDKIKDPKFSTIWIILSIICILIFRVFSNDSSVPTIVLESLGVVGGWATILSVFDERIYSLTTKLGYDNKIIRPKTLLNISRMNLDKTKSYIGELHVEIEIKEVILALSTLNLPPSFIGISSHLDEIRNKWEEKLPIINDKILQFTDKIHIDDEGISQMMNPIDKTLLGEFKPLINALSDIETVFKEKNVKKLSNLLDKIHQGLQTDIIIPANFMEDVFIKANIISTLSRDLTKFVKFEDEQDELEEEVLNELYKEVDKLKTLLDELDDDINAKFDLIKNCKVFLKNLVICRRIMLIGQKGVGKSHFLINLCRSIDDEAPFIFLNGVDFDNNSKIETQILDLLKVEQDFVSFVEELIKYAKSIQKPVLFIIDALNESKDPRIWKHLDLVIKHFSSPWIIPIVSTRPSFYSYQENTLFPTLNEIWFSKMISRNELIKTYQNYFEIKIKDNPLIQFTPLELRLLLENAKQSGVEIVEINMHSLKIVTEDYVKTLNHLCVEKIDIDPYRDHINEALIKIAEKILEEKNLKIQRREIYELLDKEKDWSNSITKFLIEEEVLVETTDFLQLSGQFLSEYAIREFLLQIENQEELIVELILEKNQWIDDGLKDYVSKSKNLLLYVLDKYRNKFCEIDSYNSWKSRLSLLDLEAVLSMEVHTDEHKEFIANSFTIYENFREIILQGLDKYSFENEHPFNSLFLNDILSNLTMIDRDIAFGEYLRKTYEEQIDILKEIHLASRNIQPILIIHRLKWNFSSNIRNLRDLTTLKLVNIGKKHEIEFLEIFFSTLSLQDLYIIERMFAVLLGIVSKIEIPPDWKDRLIDLITSDIFETGKFEHLLIRDYAYNILILLNPELADLNLFANVSGEFGYDEECKQGMRLSNPTWGLSDGTVKMDFSKYILGPISQNAKLKRNTELPKLSTTLCQIRRRIKEIGYEIEKFRDIDDKIIHQRGVKGKIERWAKKYSWIAFHELAAKRFGKFPHILSLANIRYKRDIEPTFPELREIKIKQDLFNDLGLNWEKLCLDFSFINENFILEDETDWVVLDMEFDGNIDPYSLSFEVNSILIPIKQERKNLLSYDMRQIIISDVFSTEDPSLHFEKDYADHLVWYYNWEGHQNSVNESFFVPQPIPFVISKLNLKKEKGSFDWNDSNGDPAIISRSIINQEDIKRFSAIMIRKDLLLDLIKEEFMIYKYSIADKTLKDEIIISHFEHGYLNWNLMYQKLLCQHNPTFENNILA